MFDTFLISFYGYAATGMYKGDNNAKDKIDALSEYLNTLFTKDKGPVFHILPKQVHINKLYLIYDIQRFYRVYPDVLPGISRCFTGYYIKKSVLQKRVISYNRFYFW